MSSDVIDKIKIEILLKIYLIKKIMGECKKCENLIEYLIIKEKEIYEKDCEISTLKKELINLINIINESDEIIINNKTINNIIIKFPTNCNEEMLKKVMIQTKFLLDKIPYDTLKISDADIENEREDKVSENKNESENEYELENE